MAAITIQVYLTDTLTAVAGVSIAAWLADDTSVTDSGVTDANGQIDMTLGDANYTARGFLDDYTVTETDFTVVGAGTHIVYVDAVNTNANTYVYYKNEIINRLKGKNDTRTLSMIMSSFNETLEMLSTLVEWPDLMDSVISTLTANDGTYTFAEFGITNVKDIISIRVNDGTDYQPPLVFISPLDWDTYVATTASVDVDNVPKRYTRRLGTIILQPAPDDTYTYNVVARMNPTLATGDASAVELTSIEMMLLSFATGYTWAKLENKEASKTALAIGNDLLSPYLQSAVNNRFAKTRAIITTKAFN